MCIDYWLLHLGLAYWAADGHIKACRAGSAVLNCRRGCFVLRGRWWSKMWAEVRSSQSLFLETGMLTLLGFSGPSKLLEWWSSGDPGFDAAGTPERWLSSCLVSEEVTALAGCPPPTDENALLVSSGGFETVEVLELAALPDFQPLALTRP